MIFAITVFKRKYLYKIRESRNTWFVSVFKCVTIKTVHGRRMFHTWKEVEELLASKQVPVTKVITHRFPMSKFEDAFATLFSGAACKIVMDPSK